MFAQHVAGYVGPSVERRGKNAEEGAVWSMAGLQALLDEWIVHNFTDYPAINLSPGLQLLIAYMSATIEAGGLRISLPRVIDAFPVAPEVLFFISCQSEGFGGFSRS